MKIKICGLFREDDIMFANEARPDYIGFVFAKSRRQVTPVLAAKLRARLNSGIVPVGVFVNAPREEIESLYQAGIIEAAQLHGSEDGEYIAALKKSCEGIKVIKTVNMENGVDSVSDKGAADLLLLDNGAGGTGRRFDWSFLQGGAFLSAFPCFIAGGITVDNIDEALSFRPFGIDVSSGAETNGVKDRDKMIRLVTRVAQGNQSISQSIDVNRSIRVN
jgi:phosphoribosylanthranilate isomerase